jgi:hypothetical protein
MITIPARVPNIPESCRQLDRTIVEQVLASTQANITASARILGVPTSDLRRLVVVDNALAHIALEAEERRLDRAEAILDEALSSGDARRRDAAASFVLRSQRRARVRGWRQTNNPEAAVGSPPALANTVIRWGDGQVIARFDALGRPVGNPPLIEHAPDADDANTAAQ